MTVGEPTAELMINATLPRSVPMGESMRFGREHKPGIVGLADHSRDKSVSRDQGGIGWVGDSLVLTNSSSRTKLSVEYRDTVLHTDVPPGARHVFTADALVIAPGGHTISVRVPPEALLSKSAGTDTVLTTFRFSDDQLDALVATYCGYLRRFPDHAPEPLAAKVACRLLGVELAPFRHRLDRVKAHIEEITRLDLAGQRPGEVARQVFAAGALRPQDIKRIGEEFTWLGPS
ncbi:hypothetical protein ACE2AJ_09850 [Aquihabitans daechungensis]|uniref:hypothetical protein n=1 Tax=Aquihabitans daechungensis TaxID=1052257 RepID=UPI003BA20574